MRLKSTIISLISVAIIAITGILLYVYWPAITGTINNSGYLTPQQGQEMYDKGYSDGNKAEEEQLAQIAYYQQLTDEYYIQVGLLNNEISQLNGSISSKNETITELTNIKNTNLQTIENLNTTISTNETTIANLNSQISSLNNEITVLENTVTDNQIELINKQNSITSLTNQVNSLMTLKTQLEQTNQSNLNTISILNAQIVSLNNQVSSLNLQIQNNSNNVTTLNNRISELETSISYYESFISSLQNSSQVVATFEYDGSVYNIQVVATGSTISVTSPSSTTYKVFNGWTVNGQSVNLASYVVSSNTTFVADVTYKYDVTFRVDNIGTTQIVEMNGYATIPTAPTKSGYEFDGWTLNGTDVVDISTYAITNDTTFFAKFTKIHTVLFMYESRPLVSRNVRNNSCVENVSASSLNTTYKIFNGWSLNGTIVDLSTYHIVADTTFVADITYKYDVTFRVDNSIRNRQVVEMNCYATIPTAPTKSGYKFIGWSLNGTDIVDPATTAIISNTDFFAIFAKGHTVSFVYNNGSSEVTSTQTVYNGEFADLSRVQVRITNGTFVGWTLNGTDVVDISTYTITSDITFTAKIDLFDWQVNNFNGLTNFDGSNVWSDGTNVYYSSGSNQYVLDVSTNTWSTKTWTGLTSFRGTDVWFDGLYYNVQPTSMPYSSQTKKLINYRLNIETSRWERADITFSQTNMSSFYYGSIWSFNGNVFYSYSSFQFKLNKETSIFESITWTGLTSFSGSNVWSDGTNVYYSSGSNQYVLEVSTNTWSTKTWTGLTSFSGSNVWTDGTNIYYSSGSTQYVLDVSTNTWSTKTWTGLPSFVGSNVWTDGTNIYCSSGNKHYKLVG